MQPARRGRVIPAALREAAARLAPFAGDLGSDSLVFVVLAEDEIGSHVGASPRRR